MSTADTIYSNPCIRCGQQRIDGKTWKEKIENHFGTSFIIHTETVCPDKKCQKMVEERLNKERQRTQDLKNEKEKRLKANLASKRPVSIKI